MTNDELNSPVKVGDAFITRSGDVYVVLNVSCRHQRSWVEENHRRWRHVISSKIYQVKLLSEQGKVFDILDFVPRSWTKL